MLLYTLLLDDTTEGRDFRLWNIYHHVLLDQDSWQLLCSQAGRLGDLATSLTAWHDSPYGKCLRMCDHATLKDLGRLWRSYDVEGLEPGERQRQQAIHKGAIKKATDFKEQRVGPDNQILTGLRSAAPASIQALNDLPPLYHKFWRTGTTNTSKSTESYVNPTFATLLSGAATLHYGTDPLLGFHLSTAYVPLMPESPLSLASVLEGSQRVIQAARLQFQVWGDAFKKRVKQGLLLRFFAGEALRFCHALQLMKEGDGDQSTNFYHSLYNTDPLVLGGDYGRSGEAPTSFNTIDTSNLIDHLGAINLIIAALPLLDYTAIATMFTDSLVQVHGSITVFLDELLCGHFAAMTTLLGLFPIEYWTNATGVSHSEEAALDQVLLQTGQSPDREGQRVIRLAWRRSPQDASGKHSQGLKVVAEDLAHAMHQIYLSMFQSEDLTRLISTTSLSKLQKIGLPSYHRGSFVAFLSFLRSRLSVDWSKAMHRFIASLHTDSTLAIGPHYLQELFTVMHLFKVHSVNILRSSDDQIGSGELPPILSVTLRIPRSKLSVFTRRRLSEIGTPPLQCVVQSSKSWNESPWQNFFACVHTMFGDVTIKGADSWDDLAVDVAPDQRAWSGNSDLVVCFYAPRWMLLQEPGKSMISLRLQSAPITQKLYMKDLGMELKVFETTLGDKHNVFISRYWPNQNGLPAISSMNGPRPETSNKDEGYSTSIALVSSRNGVICEAIESRLSLLSPKLKAILREGASVRINPGSACTFSVTIDGYATPLLVKFPAPVVQAKCKTRIARTSSYIELEAPLCKIGGQGAYPFFVFPLELDPKYPLLQNLSYLGLPTLPVVDLTETKNLQWMITHVSFSFSGRERKLRDAFKIPGAPPANDARVNFKDGLFSMFMHFTGLQGQKARVFGLNNPENGGVNILIFVSCLRLDTSNHTVILDAAVLPLTPKIVQRLGNLLGLISNILCQIKVDDDEMKLWRYLIPAYVERARSWHHSRKCEYRPSKRIPLSLEQGTSPICSCGNRQLPPNFIPGVKGWETFAKDCTRIAISPVFPSPLVEPDLLAFPSDGQGLSMDAMVGRGGGGDRRTKDTCWTCGKQASLPGVKLMSCVKCKQATYCSKDCQKLDWREHKKLCAASILDNSS